MASLTPTSWRKWRRKSTPGRQDLRSCLSGGPERKKSFWSSRREGDVSAFRKEFDLAVGERAQISALVSTRFLEIRDLDETVEKEEFVDALCLALGRPTLNGSCRLFTRIGAVKTWVIRLATADAFGSRPLLQVPWVRPRVPGLQQPRQEKRLLGVQGFVPLTWNYRSKKRKFSLLPSHLRGWQVSYHLSITLCENLCNILFIYNKLSYIFINSVFYYHCEQLRAHRQINQQN